MKLSSLTVRDPEFRSRNPPHQIPLVAASSFEFASLEQGESLFEGREEGHVYGRFGNPTVDAAAAKIAALESYGMAEPAPGLFCASGMAAIATALLGCCAAGDTILTQPDLYGGTSGLIDQLAARGISKITTDLRNSESLEDMLSAHPEITVVYVETPSNPTLRCTDLAYLADLTHHYGARLIADNTFATPLIQRPLTLGADIVVHSTTKYLNGHGSGIAGAIVCRDEELLRDKLVPIYRLFGGSGNPWDAWLVLNGLKTLDLRMREHTKNAGLVADFLDCHKRVPRVNYPGLPNHPDAETIRKQMHGYGGMLSFELEGGAAAGRAFMNRLKFCTLTPTLGDVDTLVLHPATMSHRALDPEVRRANGITDGLIRLSVGIEDIEDITADLRQAIG